jgi:hypothetical protein
MRPPAGFRTFQRPVIGKAAPTAATLTRKPIICRNTEVPQPAVIVQPWPERVAAEESPGKGAFALRGSGDRPVCGFLCQCPVSGSSDRGPQPAVCHEPGGWRGVFSFCLPGRFGGGARRRALPRVAGEIPCSLPQSLASSSVAVRPAYAVRERKSASSWSSASPYSAQIWSIEVVIPA